MLYELRTYIIVPGRMPDIERRFSQVTLRLFRKHGMEIVGFWRTVADGQPQDELVYVLAHQDAAARAVVRRVPLGPRVDRRQRGERAQRRHRRPRREQAPAADRLFAAAVRAGAGMMSAEGPGVCPS